MLAHFTGLTPLEGYLATSPGGVYAVLATAVETGSNVTFIIAAQVLRILLMLFAAPFLARAVVWVSERFSRQSRAITRAEQGAHPRRGLTARLQHLVVAERLPGHPCRQIRHQRHRQHLRPGRAGRDRLVHGRHADQVRAQGAQHPDLGGRLVMRAGQPGVDALGQRRVDLAGEGPQPRRVRVDQVDELRADQR